MSARDAAASHAAGREHALSHINLTVRTGELVLVVGPVGAGKSSLLASFTGEVEVVSGKILSCTCVNTKTSSP